MKTSPKIVLGSLVAMLIATGAAEAAEGWARSTSWLRAGPGASYPAITRVSAGEAVSVHGCVGRWSWCDVSVDGERGWFPGRRIALLDGGRRVELPAAAGILGLSVLAFQRDRYWNDHYRDRPFHERRWDRERHHREFRPPIERRVEGGETRRPGVGVTRPVERMRHDQRPRPGGDGGMRRMPAPESSHDR